MTLEVLIPGCFTVWAILAGVASLLAEKLGLPPRRWYLASLLSGPVSWVLLYLKVRDRRERVGPGPKRSGKLREIRAEKRKKAGFTIR